MPGRSNWCNRYCCYFTRKIYSGRTAKRKPLLPPMKAVEVEGITWKFTFSITIKFYKKEWDKKSRCANQILVCLHRVKTGSPAKGASTKYCLEGGEYLWNESFCVSYLFSLWHLCSSWSKMSNCIHGDSMLYHNIYDKVKG